MNLKKISLIALVAVLLFTTCLTSCFAIDNWFDIFLCPPCLADWISSQGCNSGCGGGGSLVSINAATGQLLPSILFPYYPIPFNLRKAFPEHKADYGLNIADSTHATLSLANGYYSFTPSSGSSWTCSKVPGLVMTTSTNNGVISATVTFPDGSEMDFTNLEEATYVRIDNETLPNYHLPVKLTDPKGRETNYTLNDDGMPASVILPDGRPYEYNYDEEGILESVTYPDGEIRMVIEGGLWPTSVKVVDPQNPTTNYAETTYTYDGAIVTSITESNHVKTVIDYYPRTQAEINAGTPARVRTIKVLDDLDYITAHSNDYVGYTPKVYSLTEFWYSEYDGRLYDDQQTPYNPETLTKTENSVSYGCTRIRRYSNPGSFYWDEVVYMTWVEGSGSESNDDKIEDRWYYLDSGNKTFLYKEVAYYYDSVQSEFVPLKSMKYTREVSDPLSWAYGRVDSITEIDYEDDTRVVSRERERVLESYDYYDPDVDYAVPSYDPDDIPTVPYSASSGTVPGNGMVRQVTYLPGDSESYTVACNYAVTGGVMKPFVQSVKDKEGKVTNYLLDTDGSTLEVWRQMDSSMVKTNSYTYYSSCPTNYKGLMHTSTTYGVATQGVDTSKLTTYGYSYTCQALVETTSSEGKTWESVYNLLGQLVSSIDEYGNTTTYAYDWKGRPTTTTYPLTDDDVRLNQTNRTIERRYDGCCYLSSIRDENDTT